MDLADLAYMASREHTAQSLARPSSSGATSPAVLATSPPSPSPWMTPAAGSRELGPCSTSASIPIRRSSIDLGAFTSSFSRSFKRTSGFGN
ncbi:hypothetical protein TSOC_009262 [Tetrabaena socialis]|uniref:Uncharacterized protein n=1 Tax=Tetrabaena socialis TaxID=47790 RepID=A0A2J7ZWC4_9CHLO|nr:hypothetical protein TSOC_009262 [Tetrabaena socialis]|eukprot:PNH04569.1 hypothetical protein TSOC_009262 [Tetrabaena socialis]